MAIQVSYSLGDDATYRRETGALEKFLNVYPDFTGGSHKTHANIVHNMGA